MKEDLTRWNRAGLKRFRYVDDNAATLLEAVRRELLDCFPAWSALDADVPAGEDVSQRNLRLERQYEAVVREWGWEIARSFLRAVHVLTEHADAYANEGYLGTATQWENVRRLVGMIGYSPAPPASASTPLVLLAKEAGVVAAGFQVKHAPKSGVPIIFETVEELTVYPAFNEMRLKDWNVSPAPLSKSVWQLGEKQELAAGALAIVRDRSTGSRVLAKVIDVDGARRLTLHYDEPLTGWRRGDAELLCAPAAIHAPRLNGSGVTHLGEGHGLTEGDDVAWQKGGTWHFDTVETRDSQAVAFRNAHPGAGTALHRVMAVEADDSGTVRFPSDDAYLARSVTRSGSLTWPSGVAITTQETPENDYNAHGSYNEIPATAGIGTVYLVSKDAAATAHDAPAKEEFSFPGSPGGLTSGDLVIAELSGATASVLAVKTVTRRESDFTLTFDSVPAGRLLRIHGPLKERLRPVGYDDNSTHLSNPLQMEWGAGGIPAELRVGKRVVLERLDRDNNTVAAHGTRIAAVDPAAGTITLDRLPTTGGYTCGNTVMRGNVALAGHGERKPARVLGNGDATRSYQEFLLPEAGVSFVAAADQPSGVAAAVTVTVAGQIWGQRATLDDSAAADPHFTVQLTEDGYLRLSFGDGVHGRRLPTGTGNVTVSFRTGAGLAGNLPAGSLVKPVAPHPLVEGVRHPLDATGGNDREGVESLRSNAPSALFTLGRAVSLEDYARLAERNAGIWQARSFRLAHRGAQQERVQVVVVPAGGGQLGELAANLKDFLEANDLPGAGVTIVNHTPVPFDLEVTVQVDSSQYLPPQVADAVRQALVVAFDLKARRLGQPLYVSELYKVVEGTAGVANSDCLITAIHSAGLGTPPRVIRLTGDAIRLVQPEPDQVLVLDERLSTVTVRTKEFAL